MLILLMIHFRILAQKSLGIQSSKYLQQEKTLQEALLDSLNPEGDSLILNFNKLEMFGKGKIETVYEYCTKRLLL